MRKIYKVKRNNVPTQLVGISAIALVTATAITWIGLIVKGSKC